MAVKFANLASTTLSSAITNSATSIAVADASLFPTLGSGDYFYATIGEGSGSEIVKVTAISSNTLTVTRAQDGTTASAFSSGETIALRVVAAALDDIASQAQTAADTESVSISGDTMTGNLTVPNLSITSTNWLGFGDYGERISGSNANSSLTFSTDATTALTLDGSQNATFAGTISSGAITSTSSVYATEFDLPSGGILDWANGDARIVEGLVNNYSLSFQTYDGSSVTTALRLDGDNSATFAGTISSGAITSSGAVSTSNTNGFQITNIGKLHSSSNNLYLTTETNGTGIVMNSRTGFFTFQNSGANKFQIHSNGSFNFYSGNLTSVGTISSGAITSTGVSSLGSGTLYISTDNHVGVNTTAHVSTVLNVLDVDDEDVTLRLHTNTNSHKPVIRMNAKNSAGNAQYGDIKWNPDSPSFNFHVPYNETTPTLKISDGAISVDGSITASNKIIINSDQDGILDLNQATTGWNYIQYKANGTRKFYVGNNATDGFVVGSDDSGKLFKIDNFGTVNTGSANFVTTGTISSGTISSGNIGIGDTALSFGSGVSTLLLQGTAANNRAGAVYFREQDGTAVTALYSTNGSDGYGTVLGAYQGSIKFGIGGIGSSHIALTIDTSKNATFAGTISSGAITSSGKLEINQAGNGTTNVPSGVAEFSGQASGGVLKALSLVNSVNAVSGNGTEIAFHNASNYSPTGAIRVIQAGDHVTDAKMVLQVYRSGLQDAVVIDHDENMTVGGAITSSGNLTASDIYATNGQIFLGTADSSSGHINAYELMTFNVDTDNDDTNRYFKWTTNANSGSGSQLMYLDESGNLTVAGNLTVQGTTTTLDTATLQVEDKNIVLNYGSGDTSGSAHGAGITIQDAVNSSTDATILWDAINDEFDFSHPVKVAGSLGVTNIVTNKVVKHNGTIFDDSNITDTGSLITLGSATTVTGQLTANNNVLVDGDLKMTGSDSYIWTPNTTTGFTGFWDSNNSRIAAKYDNDDGGWGIRGEPESGTELKVHGKIKATDFQVFKELAAGGGDHETYHWNQVHAAISDDAGANTYVILDTAVPQDSYSMGGFTLICFNEYDDTSEGDVIQIYGYFSPESNGGFNGFRYVCSNPDFEPTIQVGRNSSGNTAFLISGFDDTRYVVMVARDLYLGYQASSVSASWGDGWAFSQASATTGYSNLDTLTRVGITDTQVANWNTAYTYSQVGHLPLSGGTLTGTLTAPNTIVGDQSNINMDASANGQLEIRGSGYQGAIALNSSDMHLYHNSANRGIVFGTNETNRVKITSGGDLETYYDLNTYAAHKYYVSTADSAHQRADARDESNTLSRLHWYGVNDSGGTSNFRHAWYDGNSYINVTANGDKITFDHSTSPLSLLLRSISGSSNPVFMTLEGRNSSSQVFALEIANRGNHVTSSFTDKIDFSILNNGTYYYSALRFDLYGGVETKQHIGNAQSPYAADDRYFKLTNDTAGKSGTLVTADNGNTWLNADGGKDLWLNWYSLNSSSSKADLQVGDGDGGTSILSVVGADRRVGILDTSPSYPLDVAGDIRGTGMVRADSGINVHSGKISTTSSNQTGGGNVETYYQPDGNNNHTWRLISGGTNTGYGTGAGGLGFYYQNSGGGNADYNLILRANQTSRFGGKVEIEHDNLNAEPYSGLIVKNTATSGDRLTGVTVNANLQSHYRYMLGGATKWQTRVGGGAAIDDWRLYSFTTASDILTVKPDGEGQLRLFKTGSGTQWTDSSGTGSIAISGYGAQSSGSNPTVTFSAGAGGYSMFYLNRIMGGTETFSDSSARYFDFYRSGSSKVRLVMSASDELGFYFATSTASFNVWGSGGTNFLDIADTGTTTLYALNVSGSAQVGGSNIFHAGYSNTWAQIPSGTRTNYELKFKPATNNYAGFQFVSEDNAGAGYLLIRGDSNDNPTYRANGITLVGDTGDISLVQRTTTDKAIRFVTNNSTDFAERGRFAASGNFLVGTTAEGGLNNSEGSIRAAGKIDGSIGSNGAFRFYDGTTFRGGFGTNQWASGASASNNLALLAETGGSLFVYANGDSSTPKFAFGADGTLYPYETKWDRTYHQVDDYASGASGYDVHTHWGVLCAGSDSGAPLTYTIIETNINQSSFSMGGFTILVMDNYGSSGQNSGAPARTRARIDLAGYWNPESNGGFLGWNYTTTNPRERPTIYVMANSTTGKVAFAYQHSPVTSASYPIIVACDLWLGYNNASEDQGRNWSIKQQSDLSGYTNSDQVNYVGGNGNYQNSDGSFVIEKSSGTMFSHGSQADAIGFNSSYGTYIGANNRYVYSGTTSSTHPVFHNGSSYENILHNGGQIANTYNGDHTFTNTTSSAGIKVSNNSSGGPAIKIHSTNTNGTDWWLISNSSSNTNGAGKLQLWSNNNNFTCATFGETATDITSLYSPTRVNAMDDSPTFATHTTGNTSPVLVANVNGQAAHGLVVNQTHSGYWSQIISTQRYGLNIDSHASDSSTYLLHTSIAGNSQFYVRGDGVMFHRTTTLHGVQGTNAGNAYYYADGSNGANIDYYSPNGAQAHMDCRDDGNHSKLHKYTYIAANGYGSYKEAWWDGDSYHEIGSISNAIRTNGNFVASGNITAYGSYSDRRLKENIRPFENARELIKDINVHRFNYIGKDDDLIGVIAQEVEETLPQLVYELVETDSDEVRKAVRYDHLSAVLLKVVKEQDEEIQELKALVHSLLEKIK